MFDHNNLIFIQETVQKLTWTFTLCVWTWCTVEAELCIGFDTVVERIGKESDCTTPLSNRCGVVVSIYTRSLIL